MHTQRYEAGALAARTSHGRGHARTSPIGPSTMHSEEEVENRKQAHMCEWRLCHVEMSAILILGLDQASFDAETHRAVADVNFGV